MKTKTSLVLLLFAAFGLNAPAAIALFTSNFEGNTGAHVFIGDTDNTSGSSTLTINDWTTHTSLTSISGLTAISTTSGGFAQTQGGSGAYANANTVYISRNHNLDTNPQRGFSLSFTLNSPWLLDELTVLTRHTNNQGTQAQVGSTDLVINLSGGTLPAAVSHSINQAYTNTFTGYTPVTFDLSATTLGVGTYTLQVYQENMQDVGGAYATFDGIALTAIPEPTTALLGAFGLLALLGRRRS